MTYFERVKIGYKWCPSPLVYTWKSLSDIPSALMLALIGIPLLLWVIVKLVLSPLRWLLEPLWFAFKFKDDESVWVNMKGVIEKSNSQSLAKHKNL